jgi:hypothetical protein
MWPGERLGLFGFEPAAAATGSKFVYLRNGAAMLEMALCNWAMTRLVRTTACGPQGVGGGGRGDGGGGGDSTLAVPSAWSPHERLCRVWWSGGYAAKGGAWGLCVIE